MQLEEDLDAFLEEFGDPVSVPDLAVTGWGVFSQEDREVFGGAAVAPDYVMVARTDLFGGVDRGVQIVVASGLCAGAYNVTGPARQRGDGAFCDVYLARVPA
ncbi:hypothetical protein PQQ51_06145 [Paraburkholderia xenovorans]|uniref:hypothetical protein n=1 Tax=Paraburkholderia xenovorans TaxID=36873 RepID=UPI0038BBC9F9